MCISSLTIGILGGMGPMATVDLFQKIISLVPARKDQEHLHVIIDSNPMIPDRTEYLLDRGPDPTPLLIRTALNLERSGADFIVIPCNTAHFFHQKIQKELKIEVLHMVKETANYIEKGNFRSAVILATDGTLMTGLYNHYFEAKNITPLLPRKDLQKLVMDSIYNIKAGHSSKARKSLLEVTSQMIKNGASCVVAACTEIPLVIKPKDLSVSLIDSTAVLANAAVRRALGHS